MARENCADPRDLAKEKNTRYRIRLAVFWVGVVAAVMIALTTGVTTWQDYMLKDAARHQLRAHIVVKPEQLPILEEGKRPRLRGSYYNIGRTPAYDEGSTAHILVAEYPVAKTPADEECDKDRTTLKRKNKWFVGKIPHPETTRDEPFTHDEIEAIQKGQAAVYFYGRICYADIFSELHHTDFCLYWRWDGGRFTPALFCAQGNIVD